MPEPSLISDYLAELSVQLPPPIVAELADGLHQTHQHYLDQGLTRPAAAKATLAEFGDPQTVIAAFTHTSPARHTARRLLATGPIVGACWATALITTRAWTWPIPQAAPILLGTALITTIGLLAAAALSGHYRSAGRAATAACIVTTTLDTTLLVTIPLATPAMIWPVTVAMAASLTRITYTTRSLRSLLST